MNIESYTTTSYHALEVFISLNIINLIVLSFDYIIIQRGDSSITYYCYNEFWLGAFIVLIETIMPISLAAHFITAFSE